MSEDEEILGELGKVVDMGFEDEGNQDADAYLSLINAAKTNKQLFDAYIEAGFSEDQAIKLMANMMILGLAMKKQG